MNRGKRNVKEDDKLTYGELCRRIVAVGMAELAKEMGNEGSDFLKKSGRIYT